MQDMDKKVVNAGAEARAKDKRQALRKELMKKDVKGVDKPTMYGHVPDIVCVCVCVYVCVCVCDTVCVCVCVSLRLLVLQGLRPGSTRAAA